MSFVPPSTMVSDPGTSDTLGIPRNDGPQARMAPDRRPVSGSLTSTETPAQVTTTTTHMTGKHDWGEPVVGVGNGDEHGLPRTLPSSHDEELETRIQSVLASEIGVPTMLTRLKQSVSSAKELAYFLRKRAVLEEEHAMGTRKLCRMTQEIMHRPDHRGGTFRVACDEMMAIHERMAENGLRYAHSLNQMHSDLAELCEVTERNRKGWKTTGMAAEDRVAEVEQATKKSKAKYDALAEEYDRARTGDPRSGGKISLFKMSKSLAQQEEDLLKKVQGADQLYYGQVQTLRSERAKLLATTRPETVQALRELITETDAVVALQLQKYSTFCEKLLLSNALATRPLADSGESKPHRGLQEALSALDSNRDLMDYILAHQDRVLPNHSTIEYARNPVLNAVSGMRPPQPSFGPLSSVIPPSSQAPIGPESSKTAMYSVTESAPPASSPHQHQHLFEQRDQHPQPPASFIDVGAGAPQSPGGTPLANLSTPQQLRSSASSQQQRPRHEQQWHTEQRLLQSHVQHPPPPQLQQHSRRPDQKTTGPPVSEGGSSDQYAPLQTMSQHVTSAAARAGSPLATRGPPQLGALSFQAELSLDSSDQQPQSKDGTRSEPLPPQPLPLPVSPGHARREGDDPVNPTPPDPHQLVGGILPPATGSVSLHSGGIDGASKSPDLSAFSPPRGSPQLTHTPHASRIPGKMFHLSLAALYERDNNPVPLVVNQCIQAVELFGLNVEGIYRQSGSLNHINNMKALFDKDPHISALDFRRPDNFHHDINSVAGLLKQFFRDLPDPLLTQARYQEFIVAAKKNDDIVRRDMLHAIINGLDDPNYATLRALALHLHRVSENKAITRMDSHNLAVVFGPTLMGTNLNLADSGWQVRVIETILANTHQIFDED